MSLHFIYGNPGSGKSERLYDELITQAKEDPFLRIFLIVPEQFTLETQKKMVRRSEGHVITNIDVVSFERLAFRAFEEIGIRPAILEDHGKSLLLRKIASEHEEELTFLRANIRKIGYIDEVKSMLSELMQYAVSPDDLQELLEKMPQQEMLFHKLSDLLIMYRGMEERFAASLLVAERLLDTLADHTGRMPMLQNAVYAFDGFTGFTPVQAKLIRALMQVASEFWLTVTLDIREDGFLYDHFPGTAGASDPLRVEELFYMSKKMMFDMARMAAANQLAIAQPLQTGQTGTSRFSSHTALRHLEQNLFRKRAASYPGEQDEIHVTSCASPKEELECAVWQIAKMVRESGCRYHDFAIVSANADVYDKYANALMRQYHIPYFSDRKRDIMYHPLTETIRGLLEIVSDNYSIESVFRLLKAGLVDFTDQETCLFETYCIARGIRGHKKFSTPFRVPTRQMRDFARRSGKEGEEATANEMLQLNALRKRLMDLTAPLYALFSGQAPTVRKISKEIYVFLQAVRAEEKLAQMQSVLSAEEREDESAVYEQIWPAVMDLLDKYVTLLGNETMDAAEYAEILDAGFSGIRIGILPPGSDCVILGDIERTRLDGIRYLFFLGLNNGIVPQAADRGGILSQYDREKLAQSGLQLAPTAREDVFLQRFYLYWNLTRPSDRLFLTFARLDPEGNAIRPSSLLAKLQELFPNLHTDVFHSEEDRIPLTVESAIPCWLSGIDQAVKGNASSLWKALHQFLSKSSLQDAIRHYMDLRFAGAGREMLSAQTAELLYGKTLSNSVSRLEKFVSCPYRHFLDYGLRLSEREEFLIGSADLGTMMHDVLSRFSIKVDQGSGWMDITPDEWEPYLAESILETELGQTESVLYENATNMHRLDSVKRVLFASAEAMIRQIRAGLFLPADYELFFQVRKNRLQLNGRIDRCDLFRTDDKTWVRIIDYKSGNQSFRLSDFYYGRSMQLVLYIEAVLQEYRERGTEVQPGGIFYYHLDDALCDYSKLKDGETPEEAVFEEYKLRGLVNSDPEVFRNMDTGFTKKSLVIPVSIKKDGMLTASSKAADKQQFELLRKHAIDQCVETGERILSGEITPAPFETKAKSGCDYCLYRGICGFDLRIPGYHKNQMPELEDQEVWEKLEGELADHGSKMD